jgi:hypothetical protein
VKVGRVSEWEIVDVEGSACSFKRYAMASRDGHCALTESDKV